MRRVWTLRELRVTPIAFRVRDDVQIASGRAPAVGFWYRTSPRPLAG